MPDRPKFSAIGKIGGVWRAMWRQTNHRRLFVAAVLIMFFKDSLSPRWLGPHAALLPLGIGIGLIAIALGMQFISLLRMGKEGVTRLMSLFRRLPPDDAAPF